MIKKEKKHHQSLKFLLARSYYQKSRKEKRWFFIKRPHQYASHFTSSNAKGIRATLEAAYFEAQYSNPQPNKTPSELIFEFETQKNAAGQLLHPHFAEVRFDMGLLIANGKASNLEDAYSKAIKARMEAQPSSDT